MSITLGHDFAAASGSSRIDCHWIGYRFDAEHGFTPQDGESWIGQSDGGQSHTLMSQRGWMTGIWRTDSCVWVCESAGRVYMNPSFEARAEPWNTFKLKATLQGIWGLNDELVFTWGIRAGAPVAFLFSGTEWVEIDSPGLIGSIRGIRNDLIYAVGQRGLIARWDGHTFSVVHGPTDGNLSDVFIVSEDEMYACGTNGHLLQGTVYGWEELLRFDGMLHCVTKWNNMVWVGAGADGLFVLQNDELKLLKQTVKAERFDTRELLLITAPNALVHTENGADFTALFVSLFEELTSGDPPSWRP